MLFIMPSIVWGAPFLEVRAPESPATLSDCSALKMGLWSCMWEPPYATRAWWGWPGSSVKGRRQSLVVGHRIVAQHKKVSWPVFNQTVCALRFFYHDTLHRNWMIEHIP